MRAGSVRRPRARRNPVRPAAGNQRIERGAAAAATARRERDAERDRERRRERGAARAVIDAYGATCTW